MKIKEELENYKRTIYTINRIKEEIKEILDSRTEIAGPSYDVVGGIPKRGFKQSNLEKNIINTYDKIQKKKNIILKLEKKLNLIDSIIILLKEEEKDIIISFYLQGVSNRKIAERYNVSVEAMKKRKKRIINKMQKEYDNSLKS